MISLSRKASLKTVYGFLGGYNTMDNDIMNNVIMHNDIMEKDIMDNRPNG